MIILIILSIAFFIFNIFIGIVVSIIGDSPVIPDLSQGIGLVFGNIWLLNSFLPVSDLFVALSFAVTFKFAFFGYKIIVGTMELLNFVRRTFISFRL